VVLKLWFLNLNFGDDFKILLFCPLVNLSSFVIEDLQSAHNTALMATSIGSNREVQLLFTRIHSPQTTATELDDLWRSCCELINKGSDNFRNLHQDKYHKLKSIDPRYIPDTSCPHFPSNGNFLNENMLQKCYHKYKMKVSELYELSTASFSLYGLADELYENYILPGSLEDLLTFYCWLEWKELFVEYEWLLQLDCLVPKPMTLQIVHNPHHQKFPNSTPLPARTTSPHQLRSRSTTSHLTNILPHKK
jgi:hypothetical protein